MPAGWQACALVNVTRFSVMSKRKITKAWTAYELAKVGKKLGVVRGGVGNLYGGERHKGALFRAIVQRKGTAYPDSIRANPLPTSAERAPACCRGVSGNRLAIRTSSRSSKHGQLTCPGPSPPAASKKVSAARASSAWTAGRSAVARGCRWARPRTSTQAARGRSKRPLRTAAQAACSGAADQVNHTVLKHVAKDTKAHGGRDHLDGRAAASLAGGPGLLAHIAIGKYCDHVPLYRQAEIHARDGVDLDRAMLADWMGRVAWLVRPLADRIADHVMAGGVIHADDTPIPVLAPGSGKTRTGRLWVYLRDERPHAGLAPPAVLYRYSPDRKGEHCRAHLAPFRGHLHADGYSGFGQLYESAEGMPAAVTEVACWAHVRRYFFDVHHQNGSPIAKEGLDKIGALFDIERLTAGQVPEQRRRVRADNAKPRLDALKLWFDEQLKRIPGRSDLAGAIRYGRSRWDALTRYVDDGRLELPNNAAENAIRPLKIGAKNWLFLGSNAGGERAAIFYTLIRTARLNGLEPEAYLREVLTRIGEHPINRIDERLPWNIGRAATHSVAA